MDKARKQTDKELARIEKDLTKQYRKAAKDITKKLQAYIKESSAKIKAYQEAYDAALKSGDNTLITKTNKELINAKKSQTLHSDRYKKLTEEFAKQLANVNGKSLDYLNGKMPAMYAEGFNADIKPSFTLISEAAVRRRIIDGDIKTPYKKLNQIKDTRWNTKQLNSSVLQGILQGESMDKIAKRILPVVNNNRAAAIRNARTMVNGAENQGRLDRYKDLEANGFKVKKVWVATGDDRTRESHLELDGQEVDIDEPFIDMDGNKLDYPGDPNAAPETVYNCRCTMRTHIISVDNKNLDFDRGESAHDKAIAEEKEKRNGR